MTDRSPASSPTPEAREAFETGARIAFMALEGMGQVPGALTLKLIGMAMAHFQPYAAPNHHLPRAGFSAGLLLCKLGQQLQSQQEGDRAANQVAATQAFEKAAHYFSLASCQPDDGALTPFRAMDTWAWLYEEGYLNRGKPNLIEAFLLRQDAAQGGFAEAQINLAIMHYRGEGSAPSVPQALRWMKAAEKNKAQLPLDLQVEVIQMRAALQEEMTFQTAPQPPAPFASRRFPSLASAYLKKRLH